MHRCTTPIMNQPNDMVSLFIFLVAALSVAIPYITAFIDFAKLLGDYPVKLPFDVTPRKE